MHHHHHHFFEGSSQTNQQDIGESAQLRPLMVSSKIVPFAALFLLLMMSLWISVIEISILKNGKFDILTQLSIEFSAFIIWQEHHYIIFYPAINRKRFTHMDANS